MYAIARYKLTDWLRRRGRRTEEYLHEDAAAAAERHDGQDVDTMLDHLPEAQAEAIRLTRIEGLTMAEASERTGVGVSALKLRVHRGMARLRQLVDEGQE
jgi:RNA polymerase sigma-70 factor (ECF subfamily)